MMIEEWRWFCYHQGTYDVQKQRVDQNLPGNIVIRVTTQFNGEEYGLEHALPGRFYLAHDDPKPLWPVYAKGTEGWRQLEDLGGFAFETGIAQLTVMFAVAMWRNIHKALGKDENTVPRIQIAGAGLYKEPR